MPDAFDLVVVGGIAFDYLARSGELPGPGESRQGSGFHAGLGGKGANAAVAAARLGASVALVGRVGDDDEGERALERLARSGVDVRFVRREGGVRTSRTVIQVGESGDKQTVSLAGANTRLTGDGVAEAGKALAGAGALLLQFEVPREAVESALRLAEEQGVTAVVDPAPARSGWEGLLARAQVVTPNALEAGALTGVEVRSVESAREAAVRLLRLGVEAAAVEAGSSGKLLSWRDGELLLSRHRVATVDTTGAGDAFAAALAVRLAEGARLTEAALFANACSALATTGLGAQTALPNREAVLRLRDVD